MRFTIAGLSRNEAQIESPTWHGDMLRDRVTKIKSGKVKFLTLAQVKKHFAKK